MKAAARQRNPRCADAQSCRRNASSKLPAAGFAWICAGALSFGPGPPVCNCSRSVGQLGTRRIQVLPQRFGPRLQYFVRRHRVRDAIGDLPLPPPGAVVRSRRGPSLAPSVTRAIERPLSCRCVASSTVRIDYSLRSRRTPSAGGCYAHLSPTAQSGLRVASTHLECLPGRTRL